MPRSTLGNSTHYGPVESLAQRGHVSRCFDLRRLIVICRICHSPETVCVTNVKEASQNGKKSHFRQNGAYAHVGREIVIADPTGRRTTLGQATGSYTGQPTKIIRPVWSGGTESAGADQPERGRPAGRRTERNDHLTDLWSEAWSELIGEKLGICPADVRKRYEHRMKEATSIPPAYRGHVTAAERAPAPVSSCAAGCNARSARGSGRR